MVRRNCVDIVVIIGDEVVLINRTKEPFMDKLVFPGGRIDDTDKSPAHACAREALEEITLVVDPKDLIRFMILEGQDPRQDVGPSTVFLYHLDDPERIARLKPDSDAEKIIRKKIFDIKKDEMGFQHFNVISKLRRMMRK
jgi:ADP-ribose pyrophosphatase YjhB (NUDIX family)